MSWFQFGINGWIYQNCPELFQTFHRLSSGVADLFLTQLNSMHSSLKFTLEKESNHQLAFLDVFVHKTSTAFLTSVYRKPTFSSLYMRWDAFYPQQCKINLIKTFVHRALMISSMCFLDDEIKFIKSTLSKNGYPLSVLDGVIHDVMIKFDRDSRCTVNKCPVYLHLPYIGSRSERFAKSITTAVGKCYFSAAVWVIFQTRTAFVSMCKDVLPPHHINSVIYKYTCSYGSDYISRTSNWLDQRIKQHLPTCILNLELKRGQLTNTSGSSIAEHMINSRECVADFNVDWFSILSQSHLIFHLKVLETLYIRSLQPSLCKQRDCLLGLNVISLWPSVHLYYSPPLLVCFSFFFLFSFPLLFSITFPPLNFLALTAWQNWSF